MINLVYDEQRLVNELQRLSPQLRVLYAATCAQRLFPAFEDYVIQSEKKDEYHLHDLLERLWVDLSGDAISDSEIDQTIEKCRTVIADINNSEWIPGQEAADDAVTSLCYALMCRKTGETQNAAWAARRLTDTLDNFIINKEDIDINESGAEERVIAHPLMQAELARQRRDLEELLSFEDKNIVDLVSRLRERAKTEAHMFFGGDSPFDPSKS